MKRLLALSTLLSLLTLSSNAFAGQSDRKIMASLIEGGASAGATVSVGRVTCAKNESNLICLMYDNVQSSKLVIVEGKQAESIRQLLLKNNAAQPGYGEKLLLANELTCSEASSKITCAVK